MKKIIGLIISIFSIAVFSQNIFAFSTNTFSSLKLTKAENFYTIITDTQGDVHRLNGIINVDELENSSIVEKIASYEIFEDTTKIISVTLNDIISKDNVQLDASGNVIVNGYYSVTFTQSEKNNTTAFLTGLSDANLSMVQKKLINAKLQNSEFSMESLDFIDAEKTSAPESNNDLLCWAATSSNMLHYSGWGAKASSLNEKDFNSNDSILDVYAKEFTDQASACEYGLQWFFNSIYPVQNSDGWAHVKNYGKSGGFLKNYFFGNFSGLINIENNHKNITEGFDALTSGSAIGISLGWVDDSGIRGGGHAITLWGYIVDNNYDKTDLNYVKALIISDSDSDIKENPNRRLAPNKLTVLNMTPYNLNNYDTWSFDGYGGVLENFFFLNPYNDNLPYETNSKATLNPITDYDFKVTSVKLSNDKDIVMELKNFNSDNSISISPTVNNYSDKAFNGELSFAISITDKNTNEVILTSSKTSNAEITSFSYESLDPLEINPLPVGEYSVTVTVNPENNITEAYYHNNSYTCDFSVLSNTVDTSKASISAQIGRITEVFAVADITFSGIEELGSNFENPKYTLMDSYYADNKWGKFYDSEDLSSFDPVGVRLNSAETISSKYRVYSLGEKIKFKLVISEQDNSRPAIVITSPEYNLEFLKLTLVPSEKNTGTYTNLDKNSKTLAENEAFAFKIKNLSTYDSGDIIYNIDIFALSDNGEKINLYSEENATFKYGDAEREIVKNSWETELSGKYTIQAELESICGTEILPLGTICAKEVPSFVVTTSSDIVNEYDGLISLREAIKYASESSENEVITFSDKISSINLSSPLEITMPINISSEEKMITINYTSNAAQLVKIAKTGSLTAKRLYFLDGNSVENGGGIDNAGGNVDLTNCLFGRCESGIAGGAIYSNGGNVKLKNCTFISNKSGYGGAIAINKKANLDMLNCNFMKNEANDGTLYNNGATAKIVYSTFAGNKSSSDSGSGITSLGETTLIGCIASLNKSVDVSGESTLYGCYVSTHDKDVEKIDTITDSENKLFNRNSEGNALYSVDGDNHIYNLQVSSAVQNGIYVKNDNGTIYYSTDKINWKSTNISSAFTTEEYSKDISETNHEALFGSTNTPYTKTEISDICDDKLYVYSPTARKAVLIQKVENFDNELIETRTQEISLSQGTTIIDVSSENQNVFITYMLWDSLENMVPLCNSKSNL